MPNYYCNCMHAMAEGAFQEGSEFVHFSNESLLETKSGEMLSSCVVKEDKKRRRTQQSNSRHILQKKTVSAETPFHMCVVHESSDSDDEIKIVTPKWSSKIWSCEMVTFSF